MDKRVNNGNKGHSTKSKGVDKRKNPYKNAIDDASNVDDVVNVLKKVKEKALDGDLNACKLFLEYYLGKPTQTVDQTNRVTIDNFNLKDVINFKG